MPIHGDFEYKPIKTGYSKNVIPMHGRLLITTNKNVENINKHTHILTVWSWTI